MLAARPVPEASARCSSPNLNERILTPISPRRILITTITNGSNNQSPRYLQLEPRWFIKPPLQFSRWPDTSLPLRNITWSHNPIRPQTPSQVRARCHHIGQFRSGLEVRLHDIADHGPLLKSVCEADQRSFTPSRTDEAETKSGWTR